LTVIRDRWACQRGEKSAGRKNTKDALLIGVIEVRAKQAAATEGIA